MRGLLGTLFEEESKKEVEGEDREILTAMLKAGSSFGISFSAQDLSVETGYPARKLINIAKKYDDRRFKGGYVQYYEPDRGGGSKALPGIKDPKSGVYAKKPAEIYIVRKAKS